MDLNLIQGFVAAPVRCIWHVVDLHNICYKSTIILRWNVIPKLFLGPKLGEISFMSYPFWNGYAFDNNNNKENLDFELGLGMGDSELWH